MTVIPCTSVVHFTLNSKWKLACGVELTILSTSFPSVICQTCSAICNEFEILGFIKQNYIFWPNLPPKKGPALIGLKQVKWNWILPFSLAESTSLIWSGVAVNLHFSFGAILQVLPGIYSVWLLKSILGQGGKGLQSESRNNRILT